MLTKSNEEMEMKRVADMHFVSKVVVNAGFSFTAVEMLAAEKPALLR